MRPRISLKTLAVLVVGALLGYAAVSSQFNPLWQADAGTTDKADGNCADDETGCCSYSLGNGLLLARALATAMDRPAVSLGRDWWRPEAEAAGPASRRRPFLAAPGRAGAR